MLEILDFALKSAHLGADFAQGFLALDHAGMRIGIAGQSQPIRPQPYSVARHHRFAGSQASLDLQCFVQCFGGEHRRQHRPENRGAVDFRLQRGRIGRGRRNIRGAHEGQVAAIEIRQQVRDAVQPVDAHGLQVGSEDGFDRLLPAAFDPQLLRDPRLPVERLGFQPLGDLARSLAQGCRLQGFDRHLRAERRLPACAQGVEGL